MVEHQFSKLMAGVRFSHPALVNIFLDITNGLASLIIGLGVFVSALLGGISHVAVSAVSHPVSINATSTGAAGFPVAMSTAANKPAPQKVLGSASPQPDHFAGQIFSAPAVQPIVPSLSSTELNTQTRAALVNIECTTIAGGTFEPISGSGVVIDSDGVILTNAHVAQFFLLRDYGQSNN